MSVFCVADAADPAPFGVLPFHVWRDRCGRTFLEFHRDGSAIVLRFRGLADFRIEHNDCVAVRTPGTSINTVERLYLQQVKPLMAARCGQMVLHGGANVVAGGAVVFLGRSGAGKSTLSSYLARAGHPLLTDDAVAIADGYVQVSDAPVGLWNDSFSALSMHDDVRHEAVPYSDKLRLKDAALPRANEPRALRSIYLLDEGDAVSIEPVGEIDAMSALLAQTFMIDIEDRTAVTRLFQDAGKIVADTPVRCLSYPRRYDALGDVRAALLACEQGERRDVA